MKLPVDAKSAFAEVLRRRGVTPDLVLSVANAGEIVQSMNFERAARMPISAHIGILTT